MKFNGYDNPQRAEDIWKEYAGDFRRLGVVQSAGEIVKRCRSAERLDVMLDVYLTMLKQEPYARKEFAKKRKKGPPVDESEGSFSNVRRKLEGE